MDESLLLPPLITTSAQFIYITRLLSRSNHVQANSTFPFAASEGTVKLYTVIRGQPPFTDLIALDVSLLS
jgi:hypothetical protein